MSDLDTLLSLHELNKHCFVCGDKTSFIKGSIEKRPYLAKFKENEDKCVLVCKACYKKINSKEAKPEQGKPKPIKLSPDNPVKPISIKIKKKKIFKIDPLDQEALDVLYKVNNKCFYCSRETNAEGSVNSKKPFLQKIEGGSGILLCKVCFLKLKTSKINDFTKESVIERLDEIKFQKDCLELLSELNPNCFYCGVKTEMSCHPKATIEHIYDSIDPRRYSIKHGDSFVVLSCDNCNQERNHKRIRILPANLKIILTALNKKQKKENSSYLATVFAGYEDKTIL